MAVPTSEYRERLLAEGCAEGLADVVLALAGKTRDDAVTQAIVEASKQIDDSEERLTGNLIGHTAQNDLQFRDVDSAIRETAIETRNTVTAQLNQRAAEIKLEVAQTLQTAADTRVELERQMAKIQVALTEQLAEMRVENERRHAEIQNELAEMRVENERQFAGIRSELAEQRVASERRHAEQEEASERRHAEQENALTEQKAEITRQIGEIRIENAEKKAEDEQRFNKGQDRLLYIGLALAGLIIAVIIAVLA